MMLQPCSVEEHVAAVVDAFETEHDSIAGALLAQRMISPRPGDLEFPTVDPVTLVCPLCSAAIETVGRIGYQRRVESVTLYVPGYGGSNPVRAAEENLCPLVRRVRPIPRRPNLEGCRLHRLPRSAPRPPYPRQAVGTRHGLPPLSPRADLRGSPRISVSPG